MDYLFIRDVYLNIILESIRFCQKNKGLDLYGWSLMTSHAHFIMGVHDNSFSFLLRDLKRHTSEELHTAIRRHPGESRREWLLPMLEGLVDCPSTKTKFQLWQPECHPIELYDRHMAHQKLDYLHQNPVSAGFVSRLEHWLHSSARDYAGRKGLLDIIILDPLIITI